MNGGKRPFWVWLAAPVAVVFGLMTIKAGGSVLFNEQARAAAGDYVDFVVWFNFLAGFAYVAAGIGLWLMRRWAAALSLAIAVFTVVVYAAFGLHVLAGGAYETRTVAAMAVRSGLWILIGVVALRKLAGTRQALMEHS